MAKIKLVIEIPVDEEKLEKDDISLSDVLNNINLYPDPVVDGIEIKRDSFDKINYEDYFLLKASKSKIIERTLEENF